MSGLMRTKSQWLIMIPISESKAAETVVQRGLIALQCLASGRRWLGIPESVLTDCLRLPNLRTREIRGAQPKPRFRPLAEGRCLLNLETDGRPKQSRGDFWLRPRQLPALARRSPRAHARQAIRQQGFSRDLSCKRRSA